MSTALNYVVPKETQSGLRLGGGVAVPIADNAVLRMDYTWTRYGAYNVNYVTGVEFLPQFGESVPCGCCTAPLT